MYSVEDQLPHDQQYQMKLIFYKHLFNTAARLNLKISYLYSITN